MTVPTNGIVLFKGAGSPLSNMYPCIASDDVANSRPLVAFGGITFASLEHAYQYRQAMHYQRYQSGFFDKVDRQAQIIFVDEYGNGSPAEVVTRRLAMSDINLMCDGEYGFNQKGRNPVELLDKHPLIVIFSNTPPEEVYTVKRGGEHVPCVEDVSLLHARFNVVRIDGDNPGEEDDVVNVVDAVDTVTTLTERDNGEDGGLDGVVVDSATDACGSTLTVDSAGPSDASVCAVP